MSPPTKIVDPKSSVSTVSLNRFATTCACWTSKSATNVLSFRLRLFRTTMPCCTTPAFAKITPALTWSSNRFAAIVMPTAPWSE